MKKIFIFIISVVILLQLVSCSGVKPSENIELKKELEQLNLRHEYEDNYGKAIYKIYENNEFKGKKFKSIKELCSLIGEELTKKDNLERTYSFKYSNNSIYELECYTLDSSQSNNHADIAIDVYDTTKARCVKRLEFSNKTLKINVDESIGLYKNYFYDNVLNDFFLVDGLRDKVSNRTEIVNNDNDYIFTEHILIDVLCGDYYISVTFFPEDSTLTEQDIYEVFGIDTYEIEDAKNTYISPWTQITINKNLNKEKIINYVEANAGLSYGYKHNIMLENVLLIADYKIKFHGMFYNDNNTIVILDKSKSGICAIDFDFIQGNIPHDNETFLEKGLVIKFNNAIFYASTDKMLEILPYICEE